ncbi:MAG: helicase-exonuclease AddAB subunit AddA, partial [Eubacterium sp.]|nr:helicase-exonuclease AddAB subunit AddA [Eubacterium sp.]
MKFTDEQQKVIDERGRDILVSAAAGSGKTAVLTQRVIDRILDESDPVDIDRMLIVTFTKAAATEMRERIGRKLDDALAADRGNKRIKRQRALLRNAHISTIHSFCKWVIDNYFYMLDFDPSCRVADDNELALLRNETVQDLLEEHFAAGDEDFEEFCERYGSDKNNDRLEKLVLDLYDYSTSYPWPRKLLSGAADAYDAKNADELREKAWFKAMMEYAHSEFEELNENYRKAIEICEQAGQEGYLKRLVPEKSQCEQLCEESDYEKCREILYSIKFEKLSPTRSADKELTAMAKALRDSCKSSIVDLCKNFFLLPPEGAVSHLRSAGRGVATLSRLTMEFSERFEAAKASKSIMEFSDLEHRALQILVNEDGSPTRAGEELAEYFQEIMTDEYQDSNLVQELILSAVSRKGDGRDRFMVGDVKQSIYGFRQARPDIFTHKYYAYPTAPTDEGREIRIDLAKNFRSRKAVTTSINDLFRRLMRPEVGGVEYDDAAALVYGDLYKSPDTDAHRTSIMVTDKGVHNEALMVATKIKELMNPADPFIVYDKDEDCDRPIRFSDIAVLLRSATDSDIFYDVFTAEGIPTYTQTKAGYFSAMEIKVLLSFLKVIDNPGQDIPLAAVLESPMFMFEAQDMADITAFTGKDISLIKRLESYAKDGKDEKIKDRINSFLAFLNELRDKSAYMKVRELLEYILETTRFDSICAAMEGGDRKARNVRMLLSKAAEFENSSYRGLFRFNTYISRMIRYQVDYPPGMSSVESDSVGIYTIHKSKGLEFPVVFLSQTHKTFNMDDLKGDFLFDDELGVGAPDIDAVRRVKTDTLIRTFIKSRNNLRMLGEEIRVLYVAMTRAREKLIITGATDSAEEMVSKYLNDYNDGDGRLRVGDITKNSTYLQWILNGLRPYRALYPATYVSADNLVGAAASMRSARKLEAAAVDRLADEVTDRALADLDEAFG